MKQQTLAILIAASLTLVAQQAQAENLLQVYQQAKGYDAQFKAIESNYLAVLERKPQALAALKPQASIGGGITESRQYVDYGDSASNPSYTVNNANYSLNLSKSLYNKTLNAQVKQADTIIAQASSGLEAEREALILRTAEAYFNFLLAQDNLEFARTEKEAISRQLEQTRAYFEAGRSAITDVKEAESRYDLAIAQEINAVNQLDLSREQLRVLTGGFYQTLNAPATNMPLVMPTPGDIEQWVKTAKSNNKQLASSKHAVETAQTAIDIQRGAKSPVVDLVAKQTGNANKYTESSFQDPQSYGASVGVQVSLPLYTGGSISSKIREAQHNFQQAQEQYDFQNRTTEQQARNAFLTVQSSISQVKANQRALTSAETAAEATQAGFEVGTRTAVDVLTSLRNVFSARRDYASSRYSYLLNTLKLRQAAGTLADQDIADMNQYMTTTPKQISAELKQEMAASGENITGNTDAGQSDLGANDSYQYYAAPVERKPGRSGQAATAAQQPEEKPAEPAKAEPATPVQQAPKPAKPVAPAKSPVAQSPTTQQPYFVIPKDVGKK
ncbi:TolC family outer membrane protein [Candidatus Thiothrix sp. Deng01]|uniref:TolC family outer membrane protein n=1 Tax=Candidatus Thiothrix phosphatis TaxID=3112415 RepID=A0ABU6D045_9GAMM|nr:TolC family outer membrane protein [Candidatus Thiothrix sp. Deng01]MEB4592028.1 TolC family outer membrane protein [Candidatus Thiothrix sp. Deng01]